MFLRSFNRSGVAAACIAAATLCTLPTASALTVTVADMSSADWTAIPVTDNPPSTLTLSTPVGGGNLGSYWRHDWAVPNTAAGAAAGQRRANIFLGASYDPGIEGELAELTLRFDHIALSSTFANGSAGFLSAAVEQGGRIFIQALNSPQVLSAAWLQHSFSSADPTDWVEFGTNAHPDFSDAGGILRFGYRYSVNSTCAATNINGCAGAFVSAGLDNFSVTALPLVAPVPVPAPQSLALVLAALALLVLQARSRRVGPPA